MQCIPQSLVKVFDALTTIFITLFISSCTNFHVIVGVLLTSVIDDKSNGSADVIEPVLLDKPEIRTNPEAENLLTLLKAFYLIKKKVKEIKLIRIGKPAYPDYIKKLGLEKDIVYLKNISNERLREIYNLCDLFIFPSLYEGWGAPGIEAAACGTPIICSDIPIFREVYRNAPIYFPMKDFRKLADLIIEVSTDDSKKRSLSKKAIEMSKKYSWSKSSKLYLKVAEKVLENE